MSFTLGAFYFRKEGTGCISGKFVNNTKNPTIMPEAALLKPGQEERDDFVGEYTTIWLESHNENAHGELSITCSNHIYTLTWTRKNGKASFEGIGLLADDLLVGSYKTSI